MNNSSVTAAKTQATLLHDRRTVQSAIEAMAEQLTCDYRGLDPVILVVMNGGLVVAGQLLPQLDFPAQLDYCHATRYRGRTSGSEIQWWVRPRAELSGRHVLIMDDILDEGHTLQAVVEACEQAGALSVKSLVLIEKLHDRKAREGMRPDYCQLSAPDEYVFGFGMDYNHYWRNTDAIYIAAEKQ